MLSGAMVCQTEFGVGFRCVQEAVERDRDPVGDLTTVWGTPLKAPGLVGGQFTSQTSVPAAM